MSWDSLWKYHFEWRENIPLYESIISLLLDIYVKYTLHAYILSND